MNLLTLLEPPKPHTQTGRLLAALQAGPVCSLDFFYRPDLQLTHRVAARIADLRRRGYTIESIDPCHIHDFHESRAVTYVLA